MEYRIFDADSHVNEPKGVWVDRVPASLKDKVPDQVKLEGGRIGWSLNGGERVMPVATQAVAGLDYTQYDTTGTSFEQIRPASYDPHARLDEMDLRTNGLLALERRHDLCREPLNLPHVVGRGLPIKA